MDDHNLALHAKQLPVYGLLGALRRQFYSDTSILKVIEETINTQCGMCGTLFQVSLILNEIH